MPKYRICVLAASRKKYPDGLAKAVEVNSADLHSDDSRLKLSKTLWQRMLRTASQQVSDMNYIAFKIGEGAGTEEQTALIIINTFFSSAFRDPDLFNIPRHLFDESFFKALAYRPGYSYLSPEGYGNRYKPEVVAIIYEVESTAQDELTFAQQMCSAQVKDDQLKRVLMFLPKEHVDLNRFEAVDLIEPKPKEPAQKSKVKPATPQGADKPTTPAKSDEKATQEEGKENLAHKMKAAKPAKPKSSKKKKSPAAPDYQALMIELVDSVQSACDEYKDKKRTKHKKEFQGLVEKLEDIKIDETAGLDPKHQYEYMINLVELALIRAQRDFSKPFLKMGKRKTWDEYATKITDSKSSYQYPKLLSKVLHDVYSKKDPVAAAKSSNTNSAFQQLRSAISKINEYLNKKSKPKP